MESSDQEGKDTQVSFNTYTHTDTKVKVSDHQLGYVSLSLYLLSLFRLEKNQMKTARM